jgi:hypothetical protein
VGNEGGDNVPFNVGSSVMKELVPSEFYLSQNYPNPFSGKTTIKFCLAFKTKVKLEVSSAEGEMINVLLDEEKEAGTHEIELDASNLPAGRQGLSEGIYTYELQAGDFLLRRRMTLLRSVSEPPGPKRT